MVPRLSGAGNNRTHCRIFGVTFCVIMMNSTVGERQRNDEALPSKRLFFRVADTIDADDDLEFTSIADMRKAIMARSLEIISDGRDNFQSNGKATPAFDFRMLVQRLSFAREMFEIPLPILLAGSVPDCFGLGVPCGGCQTARYFPRPRFVDFVEFMDSRLDQANRTHHILGFVGVGKSHLLLAYAFYRMALKCHCQDVGVPRVVYVPDCSQSRVGKLAVIRSALALAFPENYADIMRITDTEEARDFVGSQMFDKEERILFIVDGWNSYEAGDAVIDVWDDCCTLLGISADSQRVVSLSASDVATLENDFIVGGLEENEWQLWKALPVFEGI